MRVLFTLVSAVLVMLTMFINARAFAMSGADAFDGVSLAAGASDVLTVALPLMGGVLAWLLALGWVYIPRWREETFRRH